MALLAALGLGLLTAISPCPLATNIAAISFLARQAASRRQAILGGLAYTLGRTAVYVGLGVILVGGLLAVPAVAAFLSRHINAVLGPLLVLTAIPLLRLWTPAWSLGAGSSAQRWAERGGLLATFGIGILFALAFCPTSAALFFGALVPLAIAEGHAWALPTAYGLATALPVVVFAIVLVVAAQTAGRLFNHLAKFEVVLRWATGLVFLGVGLYFVVRLDFLPAA